MRGKLSKAWYNQNGAGANREGARRKDPTFLPPANKSKFQDAIEAIYNRDHRVIVRLDPEEVAGVEMMAAGEDDLREGIGTGILVKHEPEASMTCRALAYAVEAGI